MFENPMEDGLQYTSAIPRVFTFDFLEHITNNFSEDQIVGRGGYGVVYKGVLDNGEAIVVKKLYNTHPGDNDKQFQNECTNLMSLQHDNIVRLVGYCYEIAHESVYHKGKYVLAEVEKKALCFEYLHGGSLDKHLSDESCGLGWHTRYKIINGICKGLCYLHKGFKDPIYHLDLKPANILLDKNMVPKIGDFGLSRLFDSTTTCTTKGIIGTVGYMPPEYINRCQITSKFDVFSLGVIIIQVMTGREGYSKFGNMPPQDFIDIVHENWGKRFQATMSSLTSYEIKTCLKIALRCVEVDRVKRPTITDIVDELDRLDTEKRSLMDQDLVRSDALENLEGTEARIPQETFAQWDSGGSPNLASGLDDANPPCPYLPTILEEPSSSFSEVAEDDPLPAIEGLRITGEAFPGRELQASGYSIHGTTNCNFEWVRHLDDGSVNFIEGARQPTYLVTADDVDCVLAIEVQPLDDRKRKGEIVKVYANDQRKITCDPETKEHIKKILSMGHVSYEVLLPVRFLDMWKPAVLAIKRQGCSIKCNGERGVVITEIFQQAMTINVPFGSPTEFSIVSADGAEYNLKPAENAPSRDAIVLILRLFRTKAVEKSERRRKGIFFK